MTLTLPLPQNLTWERRFLEVACLVASWSKDPAKQVGCVLTDELNRIVSTGYNGPPRGFGCVEEEDRLAYTIHAEINALLAAHTAAVTAYVWPCLPCAQCAVALAQAGIQRFVSRREPSTKWRPDLVERLCKEYGIDIILLS